LQNTAQDVYKVWAHGKKCIKSGTILHVHLTAPTRFFLLWTEPSSFKEINLWGGKITYTNEIDSEKPLCAQTLWTPYRNIGVDPADDHDLVSLQDRYIGLKCNFLLNFLLKVAPRT